MVAGSSLLLEPWVVTVVTAVAVHLAAIVLAGPVSVMCAASLDDDGEPIAMPGQSLRAVFLPLAAGLAAAAAHVHQDRMIIPVLAVLLLVPGVWCAAIDQGAHRIPTRLIWTGAVGAIAAVIVAGWVEQDPARIAGALLWGAGCGAVLFVCAVITAGTPGLADVRLAVMCATLCGYLGAGHVWALTVYAVMAAGVAAAIQLLHRRFVRGVHERGWLAFGPYLVFAAAAALIWA